MAFTVYPEPLSHLSSFEIAFTQVSRFRKFVFYMWPSYCLIKCINQISHGKQGLARLKLGVPKTIKQITSVFTQRDPDQAEQTIKTSKSNAKLIKYRPSLTKSAVRGAAGASEGRFGHVRAV